MGKRVPPDFKPARILVIQLRQIGDVLLTTPAVSALRRSYPSARIEYLAEPLPSRILEGNPDIDEVILRNPEDGLAGSARTILQVRRRSYDLVIDFLANPRSSLITLLSGAKVTVSYADNRRSFLYSHTAEPEGVFSAEQKLSLLRVLGIEPEGPLKLKMNPRKAARQKIDRWIADQGLDGGPGPLVCLEPFQKWPVLEYPAEHHARLAELMVKEWDARVVVCWGPGRENDAKKMVESAGQRLILAPRTDLHELAALYSHADLWVGNDSGPRHLAASQGVPTFAVFGPTDDAWTPPGPHLSVGMDELPCRPCNRRFCPEEHHKCMKEFAPDRVFEMLDKFRSGLVEKPGEGSG